jgi:hypothetical protein
MAIEHAAATEARFDGLGEVEESPRARARLGHCLEVYGAATDMLRDAIDNIRRVSTGGLWSRSRRR